MKAWFVCIDDLGCVLVRADSRNKARTFWPDWGDYIDVSAVRVKEFDGAGPARELQRIDVPCSGDQPNCPHCSWCFEGERLDREATIARNA